ncbi:MAG: hypothetical protein AAGA96_14220 [Verrucomicrobiota bacterium]
MVNFPRHRFSLLWQIVALLAGVSAAGSGEAQEGIPALEPINLTELPDRFFQLQDEQGFFWQASGNGALTSGEIQYLQSGLSWVVDGTPFSPTEGSVAGPDGGNPVVEISLKENREGLSLERRLWFDRERSGVRVIDRVANRSSQLREVDSIYRTNFPFAWKSLHGSDGAILSGESSLEFGRENVGFVIRFGPTEGRHDLLVLLSDGNGRGIPRISGSSNRREISLAYELALPSGGSKSVLHWMLQRGIPDLDEADDLFSDFIQRGRLIRPRVEESLVGEFWNFSSDTFPERSTVSSSLRSLISLNRLIDRVGAHRRSGDLVWITNTNQLDGSFDRGLEIEISANHVGNAAVTVGELAALIGGGGFGRKHQLFLRDGRSFVGQVQNTSLPFKLEGQEDSQTLELKDLNLVLFGTAKNDGVAPSGTGHFLELNDGTVVSVKAGSSLALTVVSPWASREVPLSEIKELGYLESPYPRFRIALQDQSYFSAFLGSGSLAVPLATGDVIEVDSTSLKRIWEVGASKLSVVPKEMSVSRFEDFGLEAPPNGVLLKGGNVFAGTLNEQSLALRIEGSQLSLSSDRIQSILNVASGASTVPKIEVRMVGGETLVGEPAFSHLTFLVGGEPVEIAMAQLLELQQREVE